MNSTLRKNNKSGHRGVFYSNTINKWIARICVNNKNIHIGTYKNFEDAVKARHDAEEKYYGEYNYSNQS
jgi:hypothetical protein